MTFRFNEPVGKRIRANVTALPIQRSLAMDEDRTLILNDWQEARTWFLANARREGQSPRSIETRGDRLDAFAQWANSQGLLPVDVTQKHVRTFIDYSLDKCLSNFTINGRLRVLKTFYNELVAEGLYDHNPAETVHRLKEDVNTVIPLSEGDVRALLSTFRLDDWVEFRDYAITAIILDCGLRATEALRISTEDLHLTEGGIFIPTTNAKGGRARTVYVGSSTVRLIEEWLDRRGTPTNWLFPSVYLDISGNYAPLTRKAYYRRLVKYGQMAGIKIHPHQLRHTYAIEYLVASGGDLITVSRQLGHSSVKTSERYLNVAATKAQQVLAQQHSLVDAINKTQPQKRNRGITSRKLKG